MSDSDDFSPLLCRYEDKKDLEVRNTAILFEYIARYFTENAGASPYSMGLLLQLHKLTIDGIYPCGGEHRKAGSKVVIGGAGIVPPPPHLIRGRLEDLLDRGRAWPHASKGQDENVVFAGRWFHEFLKVHPFMGGNGRVSRAMLTLMFYHMGVMVPPETPLLYIERRRSALLQSLRAADGENFRPLDSFVLRCMVATHIDRLMATLRHGRLWTYVQRRLTREQHGLLDHAPYVLELPESAYLRLTKQTIQRLDQLLAKLRSGSAEPG